MAVFNRCYEGLYLAVVALRIDLVVRKLLLSGKTQNRIKSLSELLYNQGFGLFHDKSKPPNQKALVVGVLFEHLQQQYHPMLCQDSP